MKSRGRSPWAVLGVAAGASAADIRRAYAKRLKEIRPDEDAEGFQELVEARDLALQLASSAHRDAPVALELFANAVDTSRGNAVDTSRGGAAHLEVERPRDATHQPDSPAADASPEISAPPARSPQDALDALDALRGAVSADALAGWQAAVGLLSALSHQQRAAIEGRIIESLKAFEAQESSNLAAWPPNKWPFFDLVAAIDQEFGWRESDRVLYEVLDEEAAQDFIALLRWTRTLPSVKAETTGADGDSRALAPIALQDLRAFYNDGRDQRGLDAYWLMVSDPTLWRPRDAATYLFFPIWSWQDRRYALAPLGLLGWAALILAFAPWRSDAIFEALPWLATLPKGGKRELESFAFILPVALAFWNLIGSVPRPSPQRPTHLIGPLWDSMAFFAFPIWAIARRLYVRAAIGLITWIAIAHQLRLLHADGTPELVLLLFGTILLVAMLHLTAGEYGQRWLVYRLQRSIADANRRRIFEPQQRADFLRQRGSRSESLQASRPRKRTPAGPQKWWTWFVVGAVITVIVRLIAALM